ncbi:2-phospho-L-lactate guanylyltransferase [Leifsonia sp. AK011]|uniref:2-phospho-L-lactate guanylyltransferase n=1 Tax=Leifsonia sp. AK011 TaxID=2723075 RepID=UPI0015CD9A88|nr:2-phospho-L-lactate guanylyltransferase [Leifsonia sp. AK011]NYF11297.1 2-phospho-L-lactate guanylyltransferase [Leifsonia sp. AK011]
MQDWTIVIPVKGAAVASKSRFGPGDHRDLALAMALDTVEAALAVAPVIVVTVEGAEFQSLGARVVQERGTDLNEAIEQGLAETSGNTAVLLGDHPALLPEELRAALMDATAHPLAMVADHDGSGTALVTALAGERHRLAFGVDSRAAHLANGYTELTGPWPGLTRDIDVPDHLDGLRLGQRTRDFLGKPQF